MEVPHHPDIQYLGFLPEVEKYNAILASKLLVMPSRFESLSIVLFEGWHCNKPVLVNGNCEVLKGQCQRSNAGLWYENYEMFKESLNLLLNNDRLQNILGMNGFRFVHTNYSWDSIVEKYLRLLKKL
jgi:glycosyltransferase involved in cell wall biosynthesis